MARQYLVAGRGYLFHAPVDAEPFDIETFSPTDTESLGEWKRLGDAAEGTPVEFTEEGGEATELNRWSGESRTTYSASVVGATISQVDVSVESFAFAFAGAEINEADRSVSIGTNPGARQSALQFVMIDETAVSGLYLPNTSIKGSFPTFATDAYATIPLNVTTNGSLTKSVGLNPLRATFWEPRVPGSLGA